MSTERADKDPNAMNFWQQTRFYLFEPWWRGVWFIGAIVWGVVLNVIFISTGGSEELLGIFSVVPLFAFIIEQQNRSRKLRQEKLQRERMK